MASTHIETAARRPDVGTRVIALIALVVTIATAIAIATMTTSSESVAPVAPSLEQLRELASIYDGQQFGWIPFESDVENAPAVPQTDADADPGSSGHSATTPSLESLRRMAEMYEGQFFGPGPLDG
jgi:hypothetical protein